MNDPFRASGAILATLYRDRVTIYGAKPVVRNGATEIEDVVIVSDYPCKISLVNQQPSENGQFGTDKYDAQLFLDNDVYIPAGAILDVTSINGQTLRYKRTSASYLAYASHQEVKMVRDEKATVKVDG